MKRDIWVSIYAAIIGTSAFMLNLKNWFDSGVKLKMNLIPDGLIIGGSPEFDEKDLIIVNVTNRGDAPTMITNLALLEMTTLWERWRLRPRKSYIVPNPQLKGYPPNIPFDLEPAKKWTGVVRKRTDVIPNLHTGTFYIGVYASHRDRPYLSVIPKAKDKLPRITS